MSQVCPFSNELVGARCKRKCWMRSKRALGGCAAIDSGTTELTEHDVARLRRTDAKNVKDSIQRGRDKLALWIKLLETLEDVPDREGCSLDGVAEILDALPLREVTDRATEARVAALLSDHREFVVEAVKMLRRRK